MYVCICRAVTDSAIREAVDEGAINFPDLSYKTGCGTQCGSCVKLAREVMDEALGRTASAGSVAKLQLVATG